MDKKANIFYWSIRHVNPRTGEKTGMSTGVVIAETQEEAEKIIYEYQNPDYTCNLAIGELPPEKNYESIYIPIPALR